ncbi:MAG: M20/M25/M40 family metallo-hydrolase [Anaerovoracaceae bacterium]
MREMQKQIQRYFLDQKEEMYAHLKTLMEFACVTEDRECCKAALRYVADTALSFGMKAVIGKYGDVAVIEVGEGDTTVGILTHVDVVDIGNRDAWSYEPFSLTEDGGNLYGRGIVDDKGPVIASLYALKFLMETVPKFTKKVQLIVGTSEEDTWTDMMHYKEEFELPDYGYSPDGNFPIFNAENGYMDVELRFRQELPEEYSDFRCGSAANSVPSEGAYCHNGKLHRVTGRAAHSSAPELGENAMLNLADQLEDTGLDFVRFLRDFFPKDVYASLLPLQRTAINVPDEYKLNTTIVPTILTQEGRNICINFNVRQAFDIPNENIQAAFESQMESYHYDIHIEESLSPFYLDSNQPWLTRMKEVYESFGKKNEFLPAAGCSYAKAVPNFVSWGPVFPEDPDCAHMENEQIPEASFLLGAEIYALYLYQEAVI